MNGTLVVQGVSVARLLATLSILLLLAGCGNPASAPNSEPNADGEEAADDVAAEEPLVTNELGAVQGVVIDSSLLPLFNATVTLSTTSRDARVFGERTTDEAGVFSFAFVPPGEYQVNVALRYHTKRSATVNVEAGLVSGARLLLYNAPSDDPYVEVLVQNGITHCAVSTPTTPGDDMGLCGDNSAQDLHFKIANGVRLWISETQWAGSDFLTQSFELRLNPPGQDGWMSRPMGRSVLRDVFHPGEMRPQPNPTGPFAKYWIGVPVSGLDLSVRTFYAGQFADEANATLYPACEAASMPRCAGVGAVTELRFAQYITVFVNGLPEGAGDYSVLK